MAMGDFGIFSDTLIKTGKKNGRVKNYETVQMKRKEKRKI